MLEHDIKISGLNHPDVAASYKNIGAVNHQKGDLKNTLLQYQKALEIQTRVFGSEHPDVADSKYNLASLSLSLSLSRFLSTLQHVFLSLFFLAPSIGPEKRGTKSGKKSAQV